MMDLIPVANRAATLPAQPAPPAPPATTTGAGPTATATATNALAAAPDSAALQQALIATLQQLVTSINTLIGALTAQLAVQGGGGPPAKGDPTQSPLQVPSKTTGGGATPPAPGTTSAPAQPPAPSATGGGAAVVPLQRVDGSYRGPKVGVDVMGGARATVLFESSTTHTTVQTFGRATDDTPNTFVVNDGDTMARLAVPDSGSVVLSSGTTISWTARLSQGTFVASNDMTFTVTRPDGTRSVIDRSLDDDARGYLEAYASPMTDPETIEFGKALIAIYPRSSNG